MPKLGENISHYKIVSAIGAGGMGEVYLAEDTRLDRKVAIKVLPADFSNDEDRLRRFEQEAKATSALNHPNILTVYDIGEHEGSPFIVAELLEGEELRQRLDEGPIPLSKVTEYAQQIVSGLSAAHEKGIIHRDLKPENLFITRDERVKILDFGLAKLRQAKPDATSSEDTTRQAITSAGVLLGTVGYMSPEQVRGRVVDHRSDIFSFGLILYEMITGRRAFQEESPAETMSAIVREEPPEITESSPNISPSLERIVRRCLEKKAERRFQSTIDLGFALEATSDPSSREQLHLAAELPRTRHRPFLFAVAAVLVATSVIAGWWFGRSSALPSGGVPLENVTLTPLTTDPGYEGEPTFSPDGETIAYVSDRSGNFEIYMQQVSGGPYKNITNNDADDAQPAYSPDGKQIAFVSTRSSSSALIYRGPNTPLLGGDIYVMSALGGSARKIAEAGNFPSWTPDGSAVIYAAGRQNNPKILSVPASGGTPHEISVTLKAGEPLLTYMFYPSYSSDGHWIVFEVPDTIYAVNATGGEAQRIAKGKRPVWNADSSAIFYSSAEPGRNFSLWQVPVSLADGKVTGSAQPLTVSHGRDTQAAVSRDGKLVAFAMQDLSFNIEATPFDAETRHLSGVSQPITSGNNIDYFFGISPDGRSVAYEAFRGGAYHIWKVDRGSDPVQLTSDPSFEDRYPKFSPHGRIAFTRREIIKPGSLSLWLMAADGASPQQLLDSDVQGFITWTPDGQGIVYYSTENKQLYVFDLATKSTRPITHEANVRTFQNFSPDGKWLIFLSTGTGTDDIRAIPMAGGESRSVVASPHEDGHQFVSPSGRWLYFQYDHKNIYRVPGPAQDWRRAEPEKVTNFPESNLYIEDPQISLDGHQLFFSRGRIASDIWIMKLVK